MHPSWGRVVFDHGGGASWVQLPQAEGAGQRFSEEGKKSSLMFTAKETGPDLGGLSYCVCGVLYWPPVLDQLSLFSLTSCFQRYRMASLWVWLV